MRLLALTFVAAVALVARAAELKPAPDGNTMESKLDLSTAQSATLAWIEAGLRADVEAIHAILVDDESQRRFIAGMIRWTVAVRRLESVAIQKFGDAGKQVSGYPSLTSGEMEKQLKVQVEGNRATASVPGAMFPLELRQVDGRWRVDISGKMRDANMVHIFEVCTKAAKVAEDVAEEIDAGKFTTAEDAQASFLKRRLAAVKKR